MHAIRMTVMVIRRTLIAAAVGAMALAAVPGGAALADPVATPPLASIVGVGAGTTGPLFDQLSLGYNAASPAEDAFSWDAVNPGTGAGGGTITTKASGAGDTLCAMPRPDGSNAGIAAMSMNAMDGGTPCIDFARSSRRPNAGNAGTWISLALDAMSWTSPKAVAPQVQPEPATLTAAQLAAIYACADTNWSQVGGGNAPIVPVLPQGGSGTRTAWLAALGLTAPGGCVVNGVGASGPIEENTGLSPANVAQFNPGGVAAVNDIFPYSVGDWIAQGPATSGTTPIVGGHATSGWGRGNLLAPQDVNGVNPITNSTTSPSYPVISNASFPPTFQRMLYDVVRNPTPTGSPTIPAYLRPLFDAASASPAGWICTNGKNDIISYGFLVTRVCGSLTAGDGPGGGGSTGATISGTVTSDAGTALSGITVHVCVLHTSSCSTATTSASGAYSVAGLAAATYDVKADAPPAPPTLLGGEDGSVAVSGSGTFTASLVLLTLLPLPAGVNVAGANGNPPLDHVGQAARFTVGGRCANGAANFAVTQNGAVIARGPMTETPPGSGTYTGFLPPFQQVNHGFAKVTVTVVCPDGSTQVVTFDIWIDPSGTVQSPAGLPIDGATVTLLSATSASGPFTPVPNGSSVMSPANQVNPGITMADGRFEWDVVPGFYEVEASKTGCHPPGSPSATAAVTPVLTIPPPATGLVLTLDCTGSPAPDITSAGNATFTAGTAGTFTVTATGTPVPALSETGSLPAGVTFTPGSNGTATLAVSSTALPQVATFTVNAANGVGNTASQLFTLTVNPASGPVITSPPAASFTAGTAGTFTVTATGTPVPALTETGTLPGGVTFTPNSNGTATLTVGASAAAGTATFTITASSGAGPDATQSFTLNIVAPTPAITSPAAATFTLTTGTAGTLTVTATGSPTPTLSESGTLPAGITFTPNGNGTATLAVDPSTAAGTVSFAITASNGTGSSTTQIFTLTIS